MDKKMYCAVHDVVMQTIYHLNRQTELQCTGVGVLRMEALTIEEAGANTMVKHFPTMKRGLHNKVTTS